MLVSASELGRHLDLSRQRIGQLAAERVIPRDASGRYDLDAARVAYVRHLREAAIASPATAETARLQAAKARAVELRMAREEGELVETDAAVDLFSEIIGKLLAGLTGLPARVTRDPALRGRIEAEIEAIREAVARDLERAETALARGEGAA